MALTRFDALGDALGGVLFRVPLGLVIEPEGAGTSDPVTRLTQVSRF